MGAGTSTAGRTRPGVQVTTDDIFPVFVRAGCASGSRLLLPPIVNAVLDACDRDRPPSPPSSAPPRAPVRPTRLSFANFARDIDDDDGDALCGGLLPSPPAHQPCHCENIEPAPPSAAPASVAELAWLTVKGPQVFPMLACVVGRVLVEQPEGEAEIVRAMLRAVQGEETQEDNGTADAPERPKAEALCTPSHRELLPDVVHDLLPPPLASAVDDAPAAAAIESRRRAAYVARHGVHLRGLLSTVLQQLLALKPHIPRAPAHEGASDSHPAARTLRRLAVINAHPVALTSPHFPFMRLAATARRGVEPPLLPRAPSAPPGHGARRLTGVSFAAVQADEEGSAGRATPPRLDSRDHIPAASPAPGGSHGSSDSGSPFRTGPLHGQSTTTSPPPSDSPPHSRRSTASGAPIPYSVARRKSSAYSVTSSVAARRKSHLPPRPPQDSSAVDVSGPREICWTTELVGCVHEADVHEVYQHVIGTVCERVRGVVLRLSPQRYWPHDAVRMRVATRHSEWKALSWELRQQQCLSDVGAAVTPPAPVHFPPFILVSWMGARVAVTTALPEDDAVHPTHLLIGDDSHTTGAADDSGTLGGQPFIPPQLLGALHAALGRMARHLRLPGVLPGDVRLLRGADGRVYSVPPIAPGEVNASAQGGGGAASPRGAGVLPSLEPRLGLNPQAPHTPLRRELLERLPDAVADSALDGTARLHATRELLCESVAAFALAWGGSPIWEDGGVRATLHSGDWSEPLTSLKAKLHDAGLSMCHLGCVAREMRASHRGSPSQQALWVEMAARAFKYVLNAQWRRVLASQIGDPEQEVRFVAGNLFALLLSAGDEPARFWEGTLAPVAGKLFAFNDLHTQLIPKRPLFHRSCELTGCIFAPAHVAHALGGGTVFLHLPCVAVRPRLKALSPSSLEHAASLATRSNGRSFVARPTNVAEALRPKREVHTVDVAIPSARDIEVLSGGYRKARVELAIL